MRLNFIVDIGCLLMNNILNYSREMTNSTLQCLQDDSFSWQSNSWLFQIQCWQTVSGTMNPNTSMQWIVQDNALCKSKFKSLFHKTKTYFSYLKISFIFSVSQKRNLISNDRANIFLNFVFFPLYSKSLGFRNHFILNHINF